MRRHDHRAERPEPGIHLLDRACRNAARGERLRETTEHDVEGFPGDVEFAVRISHAATRVEFWAAEGDREVGAEMLLQCDGIDFREPFRGHVVSGNTIVEVCDNMRNSILTAEQVVQAHLFPYEYPGCLRSLLCKVQFLTNPHNGRGTRGPADCGSVEG